MLNLFPFRYPLFYKKISEEQQNILIEKYNFYNKLPNKEQKLFNHRIVTFIENHEFVGKEGLVVTDYMKLIIAGTAVMLSFGFISYLYSLFTTILIYPKNYYSYLSQTQNKGETNPKFGVIVFSWEDYKFGLGIIDDNLQLGLHEFCHALHFSFKYKRTLEGQNFIYHFNQLLELLEDKSVQQELLNSGYIREYAFTDQYEFLAVLVEHLFETPEVFKKELPEIYRLVVVLLKLDKYFL